MEAWTGGQSWQWRAPSFRGRRKHKRRPNSQLGDFERIRRAVAGRAGGGGAHVNLTAEMSELILPDGFHIHLISRIRHRAFSCTARRGPMVLDC